MSISSIQGSLKESEVKGKNGNIFKLVVDNDTNTDTMLFNSSIDILKIVFNQICKLFCFE